MRIAPGTSPDRRHTRVPAALLATCVLLIAAGCSQERSGQASRSRPTPELSGKLHMTGSSTMQPLTVKVARRFQSLHPGVRIEVHAGGSGKGIDDARTGLADIGMASRALAEKEGELFGFPLGRDGIGILVHARNPVMRVHAADIRDHMAEIRRRKAIRPLP